MAEDETATGEKVLIRRHGYTVPFDKDALDRTPKAKGMELNISMRHSVEICRTLRGMPLTKAKLYLEDVMDKRSPVPVKRHNLGVPHRRGKGQAAGRYPIKAAGAILQVLLNAENNAEVFGLDPEELKVGHIAAHRGRPWMGYFARAFGRSTPRSRDRVNIEVVLREIEPAEPET